MRGLRLRLRMLLLVVAAAGGQTALASCGTAFCVAATNWEATGVQAWQAGQSRFSMRYEFIDQDQLRYGSGKAGTDDAAGRHHEEKRTLNRNLLLSAEHTLSDRWGVAAVLPLVNRRHTHIHHHHGARLTETWAFNEPGDVRAVVRYQTARPAFSAHSLAFSGGLELPTGSFRVRNDAGARAERSLQPGSGTWDVVLGTAYVYTPPDGARSWFVQGEWQHALNEREDYRPGSQLTVTGGVNFQPHARVSWIVQATAQLRGRDRGAGAEPRDSGSRAVFVSPGAALRLARSASAYALLQVPLYQHVNGVQITADQALILGVSINY